MKQMLGLYMSYGL